MDENKNQTSKPNPQGSGSDTVSAAKMGAGQGSQSSQSSTLASHTSKPMGGGAGATGAGTSSQSHHATSQGPEHLRHQDKSAGQGMGSGGQGGRSGGSSSTFQSAGENARRMAGDAQERSTEYYDQFAERAGEAYEQASEWARERYEDATEMASDYWERGRRAMPIGYRGTPVERFVSENPVLVGVIGFGAGLLIGALLPRTRHEDSTFGRWADEVRREGARYAHDLAHRGREYMDEAFSEGDARFASHEREWKSGDGQRSGPAGRHQNH
jgi:hypothetical protein